MPDSNMNLKFWRLIVLGWSLYTVRASPQLDILRPFPVLRSLTPTVVFRPRVAQRRDAPPLPPPGENFLLPPTLPPVSSLIGGSTFNVFNQGHVFSGPRRPSPTPPPPSISGLMQAPSSVSLNRQKSVGFGTPKPGSVIDNPLKSFLIKDTQSSANSLESLLRPPGAIRIIPQVFEPTLSPAASGIDNNQETNFNFLPNPQFIETPPIPVFSTPPPPLNISNNGSEDLVVQANQIRLRPILKTSNKIQNTSNNKTSNDLDTSENEIQVSNKQKSGNLSVLNNATQSQIISLQPIKTFTKSVNDSSEKSPKRNVEIENITNALNSKIPATFSPLANPKSNRSFNKSPMIIASPIIAFSQETLQPDLNQSSFLNLLGNKQNFQILQPINILKQNDSTKSLFLRSPINAFPTMNAGVLPLANELPRNANQPFPPFL